MHRAPTSPSTARRLAAPLVLLALLLAGLPLAQPVEADAVVAEAGPASFVRVRLPGSEAVRALEQAGYDVSHDVGQAEGSGLEATLTLTADQVEDLPDFVEVLDVTPSPSLESLQEDFLGNVAVDPRQPEVRGEVELREFAQAPAPDPAPVQEDRYIDVLRADWFANDLGVFISVEASSEEGAGDALTVTADGQELALSTFTDAGQYMYHRFSEPEKVVSPPATVTVSNDDGESTTVPTRQWVPTQISAFPPGYEWGFTNQGYMDAVQSRQQIRDVAAANPEIAELLPLPNPTNGYRRQATVLTAGATAPEVLYVLSHAWGHEGGNDLVLELEADSPEQALGVTVEGDTVEVALATDAAGDVTSTVAEVVAAINGHAAAAELLEAHTIRGDAGQGTPVPGTYPLSDQLDAPASVPREPFQVEAIRIGATRDGSKPGVFIYCQEHAREWVTPLVCVETAHRLTANYGSDPLTTHLVDNLDIFILPSVNPDGTNYSMYDYNFQRRNMTNHCAPEQSDPLRWDAFGVDLNRNFRIGSYHDGYAGASGSCTSDVYAGPSEASEPEARNELWLVEQFPNIQFSMNTHSHGGYFMWAPASYIADGRETLPRPTVGVEDYFLAASEEILGEIKEFRGTVIEPGRTGPVVDVLYSAAGNSADDHYYVDEETRDPQVFAWNFEVGARRYDPVDARWESTGFQPDFATEGFFQAMEFANGMTGFLKVAADFGADDDAPTSQVNISDDQWFEDPVDVIVSTDEPATIHYTTDGSTPTLDSPTIERRGIRDVPEALTFTETTVLRWFAVDPAGNREAPQRVTVRFEPPPAPGPGPGPGPAPTPTPTETAPPAEERVVNLTPDGIDDADATEVSILLSQQLNPSGSAFAQAGSDALLASDTVFADALSSGTLQAGSTPLLLNAADELEPEVLEELERLGARDVRILGGVEAIGQSVEDALVDAGFEVSRTEGETRVETAIAIAELAAEGDEALLGRAYPAEGATDPTQAFADSLAAGGWAADDGTGLLLTQTEQLTATTADWLDDAALDRVTAVGGTSAIAGAVLDAVAERVGDATRVDGANRFATAVAIAQARGFDAGSPAQRVIVVEGQADGSWAAGFTAAALSAATDAPILLVNGEDVPAETSAFLDEAFAPAEDGTVVTCVASQAACDAVAALVD